MSQSLSLHTYRLLGRSGLRISPLTLGTMTFGSDWSWGADHEESRRIFDTYVDHGGNFIDTANIYTNGTSEQLVGQFAASHRDRLVIATKYTIPSVAGDPNSGGNHRKSMIGSVEMSLRRLRTHYIDLLYLHAWDNTTPVDEVLRGLDDLVRAGKVLYLGISNTPAWQVARMQTLAEVHGYTRLAALQIEYNLIQRAGERDLIPMASDLRLGVVTYSPLAEGILAGKYREEDIGSVRIDQVVKGRRKHIVVNGGTLSSRALAIAETVKRVAAQTGKSPSQVAIAWTLHNPAVTSPIVGARTLKQLNDNLGALEVHLTDEQLAQLHSASAIEPGYPHDYLDWLMKSDFMGNSMSIVR